MNARERAARRMEFHRYGLRVGEWWVTWWDLWKRRPCLEVVKRQP